MKPAYLITDTLDDRRELHRLLEHLSPADRLRFLDWCCASAVVPGSAVRPGILPAMRRRAVQAWRDEEASRRLSTEVYFDCYALAAQYDLDLVAVVKVLERFVKDGALPPPLRPVGKVATPPRKAKSGLAVIEGTIGEVY